MGSGDGLGGRGVRVAACSRSATADSHVLRPVGATPEIPGEGRGDGALVHDWDALLARPHQTRPLCGQIPHLEGSRVRGDRNEKPTHHK